MASTLFSQNQPNQNESWKNELYHHGILGMKWGKKNGPPYPLAPSDHSAAEKKAGWRKSLTPEKKKKIARNVARAGAVATYAGMRIRSGKAAPSSNGNGDDSSKWFDKNIKVGKDKSPISPAEKVSKETSRAVDAARNISNRMDKQRNAKQERPSKSMTDEELKKAIARMNLEKQYDDLAARDLDDGKSFVSNLMDYASDVVAIGTSAVAIYAVLKGIKG